MCNIDFSKAIHKPLMGKDEYSKFVKGVPGDDMNDTIKKMNMTQQLSVDHTSVRCLLPTSLYLPLKGQY